MEAITQHSRQEGMTCDLINKTASVLKPKFFQGMWCVRQTLTTTPRPLTNALLFVIPLELATKNNCTQTRRQADIEREREMWINIERDREHVNIGRHSHKRRQRRARVPLPKLRSIHVSGPRVFIFFLPPSPPIFTTLWKYYLGFYADDAEEVRMEVYRFLCSM